VLSPVAIGAAVVGGLAFLALLVWAALRLSRGQGRKQWRVLWLLPLATAVILGGAVLLKRHQTRVHFQQHLASAKRLRAEGEMDKALRELEQAARLDPQSEEAKREIERTEDAIAEAERRRQQELEVQRASAGSGGGGGGGGGGPGPIPQPPLRKPSDVYIKHYTLDVQLLPREHRLEATAEMDLGAHQPNVKSFDLELSDSIIISSLRVDGAAARFTQGGGKLTIKPKSPVRQQGGTLATVTYHGFGGQAEIPGGDRIAEDGSYLRPESMWYPATNILEFHTPTLLRAKVPKGLTVVSIGALKDQRTEGDTTTFTWQSDLPVAGFVLAAAQYAAAKQPWRGIELAAYTYPRHAHRAKPYLQTVQRILDFFSAQFGAYPYPKFALVEIPQFPGGYGAPSCVLCFDEIVKREDIDEGFVSHELAHQWWGNLVTPQGKGAGWLSEGFAEYSSYLYRASVAGPSEMKLYLAEARQEYVAAARSGPEPAIADTDPFAQTPAYSGVIYKKGAYVLHMLRGILGDEVFRRALTGFARDNRGKFVTIEDFQKACEKAYGKSLGWFFDQWVRQPGALVLTYDYVTKRTAGAYTLRVAVQQETEQAYTAPLEIALKVGSKVRRERGILAGKLSRFEYVLDRQPSAVTLDPDNDLLMYAPKRVTMDVLREEQHG